MLCALEERALCEGNINSCCEALPPFLHLILTPIRAVTLCQSFPQYILVCRRKKKAVHKTTSTDDKRLQSTLKRLGVNTIPGIEEVNLFQSDGNVVHFTNPKGIFRMIVLYIPVGA